MGFLVFLVFVWMIGRAMVKEGVARATGKAGPNRSGFNDWLDELWHGHWERRAEALRAARTAKPLPGAEKVLLSDRLRAARDMMAGGTRRVASATATAARKVADSPLIRPVGEPRPAATAAAVDPQPEPTDVPAPEPTPAPSTPDQPQTAPAPTPAPTNGGTPMSAPTGEAVNYETTVNELEGIAKEQQGQIDSAKACLDSAAAMKAAIDGMQQSYNQTAAAAQSINEHLQAMHLDAETLGHVGTIGDAMPAGAVDAMYDRIEEIEAAAQEQLHNAEIALTSTEAALSAVVGTYGEADATVQGKLGGDATFLHGSGSTVAVPAVQPAGHHTAPVA